MNIFERATRIKLRYHTLVGPIDLEMLWDLPLTAKGGRPSLDDTARRAARDLRETGEESFVDTTPDPRKAEQELRLEIVKHVIAVKIADREAAKNQLERAQQKQKVLGALASKEEQELASKSIDELKAELAKFS